MPARGKDSKFLPNPKLQFDYDSLTPNLKKVLPYVDAGVSLAFDAMVPRAESWMRQNARWQDQTGNARNGLRAKHDSVPMVFHQLTLFHSMPYGYWLEVRWSGKYAVIGPAMLRMAPELTGAVTAAVDQAMKRMRG